LDWLVWHGTFVSGRQSPRKTDFVSFFNLSRDLFCGPEPVLVKMQGS
jgi:hypothetical protein